MFSKCFYIHLYTPGRVGRRGACWKNRVLISIPQGVLVEQKRLWCEDQADQSDAATPLCLSSLGWGRLVPHWGKAMLLLYYKDKKQSHK